MNISVIIPNYNGEKILKNNLPSVLVAVSSYKHAKNIEIIIADDASSDNSVVVINKFISSISAKHIKGILVENKNRKERGFSKNVSRAIEKAGGEILVLLNTDVIPHKNFLTPLLKHFEDQKVFAVGCMDESIEGEKKVLRGRGIGKWQRGFFIHKKGDINKTDSLWASGGSSAFRKEIWDMLGGLDILYNPFYWEDIDISYRAWKSGYQVKFETESVVTHEHEKGAIQSSSSIMKVKTIAYRNQFIFIWKNITDRSYLLSHIVWFPYHVWKSLVIGEYAFFTGFVQALILLPRIWRVRKFEKKTFIKQDREILNKFTA